jgi:polyphosphate kinase 2 (PPK2 family)
VAGASRTPGALQAQRLPDVLLQRAEFWDDRLRDIRAFESYLARQGTRIVKIFLHVGEDEQKARLRARLDDPEKLWKFDPGDLEERARRADYMAAYGEAIATTSTPEAPWYVVPADQKWFARLVVANILVASLEELDIRTPEPDRATLERLEIARQVLA